MNLCQGFKRASGERSFTMKKKIPERRRYVRTRMKLPDLVLNLEIIIKEKSDGIKMMFQGHQE